MKKLFAIACTLVLGGTMMLAQTGTGTPGASDQKPTTTTKTSGKKATSKTSKAHKGGKKSKKQTTDTTPAPK